MIAYPQRMERLRKTPAWRLPYSTAELLSMVGKGLNVPKEGWNAQTFALHGRQLMMTIHRIARLTQRKAQPHVARTVAQNLNQFWFDVANLAEKRRGKSPQDESLWLQAIEEVFQEHKLDLVLDLTPPIQSVMSQGYSKTSAVLGQEAHPEQNVRIIQRSREIADRVTKIDETTRTQIRREVENAAKEGLTVPETARKIRDRAPEINHPRSVTIARTELARAWSDGSAAAYLESTTLTHVSILGCDAREPNSPQWNGQSTCGYENLPVQDLPAFLEVGFHPNHGGTICPSGWRDL